MIFNKINNHIEAEFILRFSLIIHPNSECLTLGSMTIISKSITLGREVTGLINSFNSGRISTDRGVHQKTVKRIRKFYCWDTLARLVSTRNWRSMYPERLQNVFGSKRLGRGRIR